VVPGGARRCRWKKRVCDLRHLRTLEASRETKDMPRREEMTVIPYEEIEAGVVQGTFSEQ